MKKEILQNLNSFDDNEYHELNTFLTEKFNKEHPLVFRKNFTFLQNFKLIEIKNNTHQYLNFPIQSSKENNMVLASLDNILINAKITNKGRKICEEFKNTALPTSVNIKKDNKFITYFIKPALVLSMFILLWKYLHKIYQKKIKTGKR